jgi:hypothetical protein
MVPPLQNSITISKLPPRPEAGKTYASTDVGVIAQRELTTQRLDLRPAGPYGSMQRTQLGLATLVDKALRRQLIGGGEVEQLWRRRSHRQSYRQLAEKTAGASEKAAGGGVRRSRRA